MNAKQRRNERRARLQPPECYVYRGPQDDLTAAEIDAAVKATLAPRIRSPSSVRHPYHGQRRYNVRKTTIAQFDRDYPPEDRLTFRSAAEIELDLLINGEIWRSCKAAEARMAEQIARGIRPW